MKKVTNNVHQHLKTWRKKKGLSQEQSANILGIEHTTLGRWENGKVALNTEQLQELARAYGITVVQLLSPPEEADMVARLERVQRAFDSMDSSDAESWLSLVEKAAGLK